MQYLQKLTYIFVGDALICMFFQQKETGHNAISCRVDSFYRTSCSWKSLLSWLQTMIRINILKSNLEWYDILMLLVRDTVCTNSIVHNISNKSAWPHTILAIFEQNELGVYDINFTAMKPSNGYKSCSWHQFWHET